MKYAKEKLQGKNIANISAQSCIEDAVLRPAVAWYPTGRWGVPAREDGS